MASVADYTDGLVFARQLLVTGLPQGPFLQKSMTLSLPGSRETVDGVGYSILDLVQFGLPDDYYQTYAAKIRTLGTPDVTDAAKTAVNPDNVVWVVVGDVIIG